MSLNITLRGITQAPVFDEHCQRVLARIESFLDKHARHPYTVELIVTAHPNHGHHEAEVRINAPALRVIISQAGHDAYVVVSEAAERAYHELLKQKERLVDEVKHKEKPTQVLAETPEIEEEA